LFSGLGIDGFLDIDQSASAHEALTSETIVNKPTARTLQRLAIQQLFNLIKRVHFLFKTALVTNNGLLTPQDDCKG